MKLTILFNQVWHWPGVSKVIMRVRGKGVWRGTTGGMSMMGESWVVVVVMMAAMMAMAMVIMMVVCCLLFAV